MQEIDVTSVNTWLNENKNFILIDVREDSEWQQGHLPKALHISKGILERDIEKHVDNRDTHIVLYCGGGYRSALAADSLQNMGYQNVLSMAGGVRTWHEQGLALNLPK